MAQRIFSGTQDGNHLTEKNIFCYFKFDFENLFKNEVAMGSQVSRLSHLLEHWEDSGILVVNGSWMDIKKRIVFAFEEFLERQRLSAHTSSGGDLIRESFFVENLDRFPIIQNSEEFRPEVASVDWDNWEESRLGKTKSSVLLQKDENQVEAYFNAVRPAMESCQTIRIIDNYVFHGEENAKLLFEKLFGFTNIKLVEVAAVCRENTSKKNSFLEPVDIEKMLRSTFPSRVATVNIYPEIATKNKDSGKDEVDFHDRFWSFVNNTSDEGVSVQIGRGIAIFQGNYHQTLISKVSKNDFKSMWKIIRKRSNVISIDP